MRRRVDVQECVEFQWSSMMAFMGGTRRVNKLAYETGAFTRARKIERPDVLLRMIFMWAIGERSVMDTAGLAAAARLAPWNDGIVNKANGKGGDGDQSALG